MSSVQHTNIDLHVPKFFWVFLIYEFATAPLWISLYMRKIWLSFFISVYLTLCSGIWTIVYLTLSSGIWTELYLTRSRGILTSKYLTLSRGIWQEERAIDTLPRQEPRQGRFDAPPRPRGHSRGQEFFRRSQWIHCRARAGSTLLPDLEIQSRGQQVTQEKVTQEMTMNPLPRQGRFDAPWNAEGHNLR